MKSGSTQSYRFSAIHHCNACGTSSDNHKILGQRLNTSQGLNPKNKIGISVGVKQCSGCNLIYSTPQPIPFDLQDHYGTPPEDYWLPEYFSWTPAYFRSQILNANQLLRAQSTPKALDIGAGLGKAMLSMAHAGFDTYGFEPSIPFYERAISEMGISKAKLKLGPVETVAYEDDFFDFITFGAVFEHLYDPSFCLERALGWLKPGGIIHIEVPSSRWLISKIFNLYFSLRGTNYVTNVSPMHPPYHLYEFDIKTFEALAQRLGFKIEKSYYTVCSIYGLPKIFHQVLKLWMKWTNTGMQLTVYLRKKES